MAKRLTYEELDRRVKELEQEGDRHKRSEEALRESEERYKSVVEGSMQGIAIARDAIILFVNQAVAKMFGYGSPDELVGKNVLETLYDPEGWPESQARVATLQNGKSIHIHPGWKGRRKDGTRIWIQSTASLISWQGEPAVCAFWVDVTERKQAEEALRKERDRTQMYLDVAGVMLVALNAKGEVTLINKKGCEVLEYDEKEILGNNWFDNFLLTEQRKEVKEVFQQLMRGTIEPVEYFENPVLTKSGKERSIAWHNALIKNEKGKIVGSFSSGEDITDRIKAEEALRESEGRYRRIVETAQEGIWMIDAEGNTIYVNRQLAEMFGYTAEEMLGRPALYFVDDSNRQEAERRIERRKRGIKDQYDFEFQRKDGSVLWATVSANPMLDDDDRFIGHFSMISDISDRKRTEEALKESEERHRALVESSSDAILMMDRERRIASCNQAFLDLFGYDENEVEGRSIRIIHQSDESFRSFGGVAYPAIEKDGTFRTEWDFSCKDGTITPVETVTSVMKSPDGSTIGYVSIIRDITERRQAEEALKESEEKYRISLQSIPDSVCINRQKDGLYFYANEGFSQIMGYSVEEAEGKSSLDLNLFVNPADRDEFIKILKEKGELHGFELQYRKKDGTIFDALISARPLRYSEEDCLVAVVKDITPIKKAEREKAKVQAQFQHAQRMESIGTLAGGLAHNFNNLLMGIIGNASIMLLDIDSSHPFHKNLKNIEKMIKSGSQVTKQLLGYAREGRYEVKPISLNRLVKETSDTFGTTRKEIRVHQGLAENLLGINADEGQIEQVLMNLFVNAADAMPEGGDLFLKTMNVTHEDMAGKEYDPKPENYVLLTVRDTGIGIDKKIMERIFDPFFTTKGLAEGTGLGLASSYGIIKAHGGYIDVDSEEGKGTTFEIYLPATKEEATAETEMSGEIVKGKEMILLVDDEEMVLDTGELMLKKLGYKVLSAMSGSDALELYKKNQDRVDMVLLDMVMPGMGGSKTFDRLKEINPKIKVLLSSGYSVDGQAKGILKRGCDGFIQKPFSLKQLSQNIRKILDKE